MSLSDEQKDPMRPWTLYCDDLVNEAQQSYWGYIDSSSAWGQFEQFFASRGFELCFHTVTCAKRPLVELARSSDNPFKPSVYGPFVHHDPIEFDTSFRPYWKGWLIRVGTQFTCTALIILSCFFVDPTGILCIR